MELLAQEPAVTGPVAIEYDENGWAYVAEMRDYPYTDKSTDQPNVERTTDLPLGRVRLLKDTDGDGTFDESYVFAEDLSWPTGLAVWKGGVFVAATPDIWYLKDTDGDHRADVREKVFTGFRKFNVQAVMNNLKWGLDHQIYGAGGTNGATVRNVSNPDARPVLLSRHDFRFDPGTLQFEAISGGARFGNTFDDWGNRFVCNIRNPAQHVLLPNHYLARNPLLAVPSALVDAAPSGDQLAVFRTSPPEPWRALRARRWVAESANYPRSELVAAGYFTSACGVTVYRGDAYPDAYRGDIFVADVAGNLIRRLLVRADGVTFHAEPADQQAEFLTSTDNWFRPVNFVNGPDGTLHVLDMYRETIEHPWSIPDDIKAQLDLESGRDRGRIYRLAPPAFKPAATPRLGDASTEQLVGYLADRNVWRREAAHRLIFERQDRAAVAPLRKLLEEGPSALGRLHALWSLAGLSDLGDADLMRALGDPESGVREHAVRLAEPRLENSADLFERVLALASDPEPRVRFQVAFSLGETLKPRSLGALSDLALSDSNDLWIRTAILSSCATRSADLLCKLIELEADGRSAEPTVLRQLARIVGARQQQKEIDRVWDLVAQSDQAAGARTWKNELVIGLGEGLKQTGKGLVASLRNSNSTVAEFVQQLIREAQNRSLDGAALLDDRLQAVQLLSFAEFDSVNSTTGKLLDPRQPQAIQLAMVRVVSSFVDSRVPQLLLGRWDTCTPPLRTEIVEAMLTRPDRIAALFDAIEAGRIAPSYVSATRKGLLLRHDNPTIRSRAAALFQSEAVSPRNEVITRYRSALELPTDRGRGQRVFERECKSCHRLGDQGSEVGPDLAASLHHAPDQILMNILDPNREVSPNYLEYVVALEDGRVLTGVIANETATNITLRRAEGVQDVVLRKDIADMRSSGKSLMPEGLENKITGQEMADLLAFLVSGGGKR